MGSGLGLHLAVDLVGCLCLAICSGVFALFMVTLSNKIGDSTLMNMLAVMVVVLGIIFGFLDVLTETVFELSAWCESGKSMYMLMWCYFGHVIAVLFFTTEKLYRLVAKKGPRWDSLRYRTNLFATIGCSGLLIFLYFSGSSSKEDGSEVCLFSFERKTGLMTMTAVSMTKIASTGQFMNQNKQLQKVSSISSGISVSTMNSGRGKRILQSGKKNVQGALLSVMTTFLTFPALMLVFDSALLRMILNTDIIINTYVVYRMACRGPLFPCSFKREKGSSKSVGTMNNLRRRSTFFELEPSKRTMEYHPDKTDLSNWFEEENTFGRPHGE